MNLVEKIKTLTVFEKLGNLMVYFQSVAPYISIVNLSLILATFKQAFNINMSAYLIVALGLLGTLAVGCLDYTFILPHRIAKANKQNDIKQDVKDIIINQKLILEKLQ